VKKKKPTTIFKIRPMRRAAPAPNQGSSSSSGIIRPRTVGLKRPVTPPEPETSAWREGLAKAWANPKIRLVGIVVVLGLLLVAWGGGWSERNKQHATAVENGNSDDLADGSVNLARGGRHSHDEEEDEEDGESSSEDAKPARKTGGAAVDSSEDAGDDEDGDASSSSGHGGDEDSAKDEASDDASEDDEGNGGAAGASEATASRAASGKSAQKSKALTVQSYFVNFGGLVVDIDKEGSYKYVLVKMEDKEGASALLVRGCPHKEGTHCFHDDAYKRTKTDLEGRGYKASVLGGGRVTRHPARKSKSGKLGYISVFGYSKTFGTCAECNKVACVLIKQALPDYGVKWANEGYLESDERKVKDDAWTKC